MKISKATSRVTIINSNGSQNSNMTLNNNLLSSTTTSTSGYATALPFSPPSFSDLNIEPPPSVESIAHKPSNLPQCPVCLENLDEV